MARGPWRSSTPARVCRHGADRRRPVGALPPALPAQQRLRGPVRRAVELEGVAALDAEVALVHRRVHDGRHLHHLAVPGADIQLAAHGAVAADAARPGLRPAQREPLLVHQGAGRAAVHAGPAARAGTLQQGGQRVRHDPAVVGAAEHVPDREALDLVADPHAAVALDALGHVHVDVGMGVVHGRRRRRALRRVGDAVAVEGAMELLLGQQRPGLRARSAGRAARACRAGTPPAPASGW